MNNTLIFIFLFFLSFFITKKIFQKAAHFMISLSLLDGVQYFLYVIFSFGCLIMLFQKVNLPYMSENPVLFKTALVFPVIGLSTLTTIIAFMKNPQHPERLKLLTSVKQTEELKKDLEESKKILEETNVWTTKYFDILNRCKAEIEELDASDLSEEEKKTKSEEILEKYNKELESISNF